MQAPEFWRHRDGRQSAPLLRLLLSPLGLLQHFLVQQRLKNPSIKMPVPTIGLGNVTLGGTGKTPLAAWLLAWATQQGFDHPAIISRGFGGAIKAPIKVDIALHTAADVGDEPLMLAQQGDVYIGVKRAEVAALAVANGADLLIFDDIMQNPAVDIDHMIGVIDGATGFGNGYLFPAGPLRERPEGLARAKSLIVMGPAEAEGLNAFLETLNRPIFHGRIIADPDRLDKHQKYLAFCGIGRPEKFFESLRQSGIDPIDCVPFGDHHPYSQRDLRKLAELAAHHGATLVTTQKDWVRLPKNLQAEIDFLPIHVHLEDQAAFSGLLAQWARPHKWASQ